MHYIVQQTQNDIRGSVGFLRHFSEYPIMTSMTTIKTTVPIADRIDAVTVVQMSIQTQSNILVVRRYTLSSDNVMLPTEKMVITLLLGKPNVTR